MTFKLKIISLVVLISLLAGCSAGGKKSLFNKESDKLCKSPCVTVCQGEPFYVSGLWVQ